MLKKIARLDIFVTQYFQAHKAPLNIERGLRIYVRLGDGYMWILAAIVVIFHWGITSLIEAALRIVTSVAISLALYWMVKLSSKRKRPYELLNFKEGCPPLDKFSFPSGHTMNNMAVAGVVFLLFPPVGMVMLVLPLTWGLLRVYFGVHWLSDVICGFLLGLLAFALSCPVYDFF